MKTKKMIGTLTFHASDNYGAVLQAYALQKALLSLGYKTSIIDYRSEGVLWWYRKPSLQTDPSLSTVKAMIWKYIIRRKPRNFEEFRKRFILTKTYSANDIAQVCNEIDMFIVGSDQVWNCDCTHEDYAYMLDFVSDDIPKVSYAASFGYRTVPKKYYDKTAALLRRFDAITVREDRGSELVKELTGMDAPVVLDPVLLLKRDEWETLISPIEQKYVFVYQAEKQPSLIEFAKKIAKKKGMKVYVVSAVLKGTMGRNIKSFSDCGPEKFLALLSGADTVVTNSFHGTALSILFNKQFYVEALKHNNTNSRLTSILSMTGLQGRIVHTDDNNIDLSSYIDYESVNQIIDKKREESIQLLEDMVRLVDKG